MKAQTSMDSQAQLNGAVGALAHRNTTVRRIFLLCLSRRRASRYASWKAAFFAGQVPTVIGPSCR